MTFAMKKESASKTVKKKKDMNLPDEVEEAIMEIGGLAKLSKVVPSDKNLSAQIKLHHILSDKNRLKILWAVNCCGLCPCVLKLLLKIENSMLSYHLNVLEKAGLVESYTKKNWRVYSITDTGRMALNCGLECIGGNMNMTAPLCPKTE